MLEFLEMAKMAGAWSEACLFQMHRDAPLPRNGGKRKRSGAGEIKEQKYAGETRN
jgi:hypothetical protein